MAKQLSKKEKIQICLFAASGILVIFGLLCMLTAGNMVMIFKGIANIPHMLIRYVVVILLMAGGIMLFSNTALTVDNKKIRNGLTIGITTFATVLTLPLLYVFIAFFPGLNGNYGPVGEIMVKDIVADCRWIFDNNMTALVIFGIVGIVLSIVFLAFPLLTGILAVKGKALKVGLSIGTLPIIEKQEKAAENSCDCSKCDCGCGCNDNAEEDEKLAAADKE